MKNKEIVITVTGEPKIGKSLITLLLKKLLCDRGFEVNSSGELDYPDNFEGVIDSIKKGRKITLRDGI